MWPSESLVQPLIGSALATVIQILSKTSADFVHIVILTQEKLYYPAISNLPIHNYRISVQNWRFDSPFDVYPHEGLSI
jgi:hypothetical protein